MLCVCVGDVMDVVFSVCIVRRGAVGARVWGESFVMQMLYVCVLCASCGSFLMLVEDAIGDHTEEAYSRASLITALWVAMSVSFCLPHPVAVSAFMICRCLSAFMICRCLCACTEMVWMCVLYVSFRSKVRPRTFGCIAMGSALLFIVRSRLLAYSAGSGVNRVLFMQVVLSGFSKRLFCFVQAKT